jgi:hypothetical protein
MPTVANGAVWFLLRLTWSAAVTGELFSENCGAKIEKIAITVIMQYSCIRCWLK